MKLKQDFNANTLSEQQLVSLFYNSELSPVIKKCIEEEIGRRCLKIEQLEEMKISLELDPINTLSPLKNWQKLLIVLFPISPYIFFWDIYGGNIKKVQGHFKYSTFGFILWSVILIGYFTFQGKK